MSYFGLDFYYLRQQRGGYVIVLLFCKQDSRQMRKRMSTKLSRHGQEVNDRWW